MVDIFMSFEIQAIIKLLLGFILAGIIGSERESHNKPAGFKTHSLIGISSVLVMLCGEFLSLNSNADISRIPAQLLSGIGFIGAGTILRDGFNVKGLTTAASLLTVTCIGLSIGAGFYLGGIIATIFAYCLLSYSHKISKSKEEQQILELSIILQDSTRSIPLIEKVLYGNNITIKKMELVPSDSELQENLKLTINYKSYFSTNKIISDLCALENVVGVEVL